MTHEQTRTRPTETGRARPAPLRVSPASGAPARAWRRWMDRAATGVITVGGWAVIVSVLGIFAYLLAETLPLLSSASWSETASVRTAAFEDARDAPRTVGVGIDDYREVGYVLRRESLDFYALPSGAPLRSAPVPALADERVTAMAHAPGKAPVHGLGTADGRVLPLRIEYRPAFRDGVRTMRPGATVDDPIAAFPAAEPVARLAYRETERGAVVAALSASGRLWLTTVTDAGGLFERTRDTVRAEIPGDDVAAVDALLLDGAGDTLVGGAADGRLLYWDIRDPRRPRLLETHDLGAAVTALAYLIGDRSLVVGTADGKVAVWMPSAGAAAGGPRLRKAREFAPHDGAVTAVSPSLRDKGFLTADAAGGVAVHYSTSHRTLLSAPGGGSPVLAAMLAPRTDGAVVVRGDGRLIAYDVENEHPEATFASLFLPVRYEGYDEPLSIWQSTGGSDEFEPKFGLWPLMFGTLKGTLYAMLLAAPIAVLGAIYTAMFMHPAMRAVVKPVVEIMAAFPTVILGCLAGLWLAPLLEDVFPAVTAVLFVLPPAILAACVGWRLLPARLTGPSGSVMELLACVLVLAGTVWACLHWNQRIEAWLFDADYARWLHSTFGVEYDQRNALVVAVAMGMAVIPVIFSIAEESLGNVPRHLIAGSLALGATSWQTLTKLVLVSASPGLFSALMIGLGRVVGETMIVLMATGNTPVLDLNLLNGFRTLSATIAIEMPEAPQGGTLYRVLFAAGLMLFVFTFLVNTLADVVRQRLRVRYGQF